VSARRAVAIGGGHGLSRTLRALAPIVDEVTAVVTVADDGGSSGRLRRDLGVLPPGDLRMAVAALAARDELAALLQYRFARGELQGHSLGNLVLVAMQDLAGGDLVTADEDIVTLGEVSARLADGWTSRVQVSVVTGQPERVRAGEETATAAVGLALSSLEHEELLGAAQTEGLRRLLLEVIQAALPDAEVERVLVTGLVVG